MSGAEAAVQNPALTLPWHYTLELSRARQTLLSLSVLYLEQGHNSSKAMAQATCVCTGLCALGLSSDDTNKASVREKY